MSCAVGIGLLRRFLDEGSKPAIGERDACRESNFHADEPGSVREPWHTVHAKAPFQGCAIPCLRHAFGSRKSIRRRFFHPTWF